MRKTTIAVGIVGTALALLSAQPAEAQATRTWVSGVGDDVNPCSRTAPCKTFAGAISKTAAGGEINCLDPGGFGAVTITKAITLDCTGTLGSILASLVNGVIINAPAGATVRIRNLLINGVGTGINGIRWIGGAGQLYVEHTVISGFTTRGIDFVPASGAAELYVLNSRITEAGGTVAANGGIHIRPTGGATVVAAVFKTALTNNANGLTADSTGAGGLISTSVTDSVASGNFSNGLVVVSGGTQRMAITRTTLSGNAIGISSSGVGSVAVISQSVVTQNTTGLSPTGSGQIISFSSNVFSGNTTNGAATSTLPPQ